MIDHETLEQAATRLERSLNAQDPDQLEKNALAGLDLLIQACNTDLAGYYCGGCECFLVLTNWDEGVECPDCGQDLQQKVITKSTVFTQADRNSARLMAEHDGDPDG